MIYALMSRWRSIHRQRRINGMDSRMRYHMHQLIHHQIKVRAARADHDTFRAIREQSHSFYHDSMYEACRQERMKLL